MGAGKWPSGVVLKRAGGVIGFKGAEGEWDVWLPDHYLDHSSSSILPSTTATSPGACYAMKDVHDENDYGRDDELRRKEGIEINDFAARPVYEEMPAPTTTTRGMRVKRKPLRLVVG